MSNQEAIEKYVEGEPQLGYFIDPYSDWGFKHLFGKEPNREALISFLNVVFRGRKVIVDIKYADKEYKGPGKEYRKTVFDIYCTGDNGEKFIVEIQKAKVENFKDRSIFYTANLIQEQGIGVMADWDYELPEIYFLAIMNFVLEDTPPEQYLHEVRHIEIHSNREFYSKLRYIYIETPKFRKTEFELDNPLEQWLYLLNNLEKLSEIPVSLQGDKAFEAVFKIAAIGNLTPEEMNEYQANLKIQRDNASAERQRLKEAKQAMEQAVNKAFEDGIEQGVQKGVELGELNSAYQTAKKMIDDGLALDLVAKYTGLSAEEIARI